MKEALTRRTLLSSGAVAVIGSELVSSAAPAPTNVPIEPAIRGFSISLNTSTLRGHKLPITETIDIAAEAGYAGIEPWPDELDRHVESGGRLSDLKKRLRDHGLKVTGGIAFFQWMVDDDTVREKALEEARGRMDRLSQIGGTFIAAPPAGDVGGVDLLRAAERYRKLLEVSESHGITPAVELWGGAKNCYRVGQIAMVAVEADHPRACILPDVYHVYKGGSSFSTIRRLNGRLLAGFHFNDVPAEPPRETIADKDRVYPGDGVAPLKTLLRDLRDIGYRDAVSVELFNPVYYQQDPRLVAKTAFSKMKAIMNSALETG